MPNHTSDNRRKRIALCLEYPLRLRGGVSVLVETLAQSLSEDFEMLVVSPDETATDAGVESTGPVRHLHFPSAPWTRERAVQFVDRLVAQQVDLVHFHSGGVYGWGNRWAFQSPLFWMKRHSLPVVSTVHLVVSPTDGYCGSNKPMWLKLALLPAAWLAKVGTVQRLDAEIAVSRHDLHKLQRWYWPVRDRFRLIYHSRLPAASTTEARPRESFVLSVGHVAFRKGQHVLAEAFAKIAAEFPHWRLVIAGSFGEPECVNSIRETARRANLEDRIELLGERSDTQDLMLRAGVFVQPSRFEALGLALQEALWLGCPCIGTRVGGIPELIDENANGLLVPPDDPDALARALRDLLRDSTLQEEFSRRARQSIEKKGMALEPMVQAHYRLYDSLLHSK